MFLPTQSPPKQLPHRIALSAAGLLKKLCTHDTRLQPYCAVAKPRSPLEGVWEAAEGCSGRKGSDVAAQGSNSALLPIDE